MTDAPAPLDSRRGRRVLLGLAALFFVPLAVAFWLYYGDSGWRPQGTTNKGDLLEPARALPAAAWLDADGQPLGRPLLRERWTVLYVGDGRCDERCREALHLSRQTRIALNKDMDRVERVFLATASCCDEAFLGREHADLTVVQLETGAARGFLDAFPVYAGVPVTEAGRLYVIDPLGNLVLSYPASVPDKALLQDLKKLLKLSHVG